MIALSKAELLGLWARLFPPSYTAPMEDEAQGRGLDVFAQQAAQMARASEAVNVATQAYYVLPHSTQTAPEAQGEAAATGFVDVSRPTPTDEALTIAQGTELVATARNTVGAVVELARFVFVSDVAFLPGQRVATAVPVRCTRPGYQGNVGAGTISSFAERGRAEVDGLVLSGGLLSDQGLPDRLTPAMEGQFVRFITGPNAGTYPRRIVGVSQGTTVSTAQLDGAALTPGAGVVEVEEFGDIGLAVTQAAAMSGGRLGYLDAAGADRMIARQSNETDESYRARVSALPDVVSPGALQRAAARVLTPLGIPFYVLETRAIPGLQGFVWDYNALDYGTVLGGDVLLSDIDAVRFFVIVVGRGNDGEFGSAYDMPWPAIGGPPAWDAMFLDGYPVGYYSALAALSSSINAAKMAGVHWLLIVDPSL